MKVLSLIAVLTAAALAVAGSALSSRSSTPTLTGTVGPGYTIHLTKGGKKVTSLKAGTYKFHCSIHSQMTGTITVS
jgi:plastocyanin